MKSALHLFLGAMVLTVCFQASAWTIVPNFVRNMKASYDRGTLNKDYSKTVKAAKVTAAIATVAGIIYLNRNNSHVAPKLEVFRNFVLEKYAKLASKLGNNGPHMNLLAKKGSEAIKQASAESLVPALSNVATENTDSIVEATISLLTP